MKAAHKDNAILLLYNENHIELNTLAALRIPLKIFVMENK